MSAAPDPLRGAVFLVGPAMSARALADRAQPEIAVDDLLLRPFRATDADAVAQAYLDPAIQQWHVETLDRAGALDRVRYWDSLWTSQAGAGWAVVDAADGAFHGRVGLKGLQLQEGLAEVAYWVVPEARGRSVAARAVRGAVDWMFDNVGLHRVELEHSTLNRASCRVAEKAGFALEGTLRQRLLHADGWHDMHMHGRVVEPR